MLTILLSTEQNEDEESGRRAVENDGLDKFGERCAVEQSNPFWLRTLGPARSSKR